MYHVLVVMVIIILIALAPESEHKVVICLI